MITSGTSGALVLTMLAMVDPGDEVICFDPYFVMYKPLIEVPEKIKMFLEPIPLGRWGQVKEIGALAAYLCSNDAGFITGTDIVIDGGWIAQ